ncbi:MAG: F-box protein [Parachlamydiales bacterium]|nr:F-box protein [Parachlamydiales bacterium]
MNSFISSIKVLFKLCIPKPDLPQPKSNFLGTYTVTNKKNITSKNKNFGAEASTARNYVDQVELPIDILKEIVSYIPLTTWNKVIMVNKSWKQLFDTPEILNNILSKYHFLNKSPSNDIKKVYQRDIITRSNIKEGIYDIRKYELRYRVDINVRMAKGYRTGLAVLGNDNLFYVDFSSLHEYIYSGKKISSILTSNEKLYALTKDCRILEIQDDYSSKIFSEGLFELDLTNQSRVFFERLQDKFIIWSTVFGTGQDSSQACVVDENGSCISELKLKTAIYSLSVLENSIVVGMAGTIDFYNDKLTCLKTYSTVEIDDKRLPQYVSSLNNKLISSDINGVIYFWNADGTYCILESSFGNDCNDIVQHIGSISDSIVMIKNFKLSILKDDKFEYIVTNDPLMNFTIHKDQIITWGLRFVKSVDFSLDSVGYGRIY